MMMTCVAMMAKREEVVNSCKELLNTIRTNTTAEAAMTASMNKAVSCGDADTIITNAKEFIRTFHTETDDTFARFNAAITAITH